MQGDGGTGGVGFEEEGPRTLKGGGRRECVCPSQLMIQPSRTDATAPKQEPEGFFLLPAIFRMSFRKHILKPTEWRK